MSKNRDLNHNFDLLKVTDKRDDNDVQVSNLTVVTNRGT